MQPWQEARHFWGCIPCSSSMTFTTFARSTSRFDPLPILNIRLKRHAPSRDVIARTRWMYNHERPMIILFQHAEHRYPNSLPPDIHFAQEPSAGITSQATEQPASMQRSRDSLCAISCFLRIFTRCLSSLDPIEVFPAIWNASPISPAYPALYYQHSEF